eukprot:TRINITY_DN22390_c0_g1_i2.p1 TRINITY_DN22390_c0_g1~~TRINITY_DN22390_c0_g1_i2.p1  ORF type:complete len:188 (-),score=16.09 TRINITY_DN22390_c0_g1_i2:32-595(-)
MSRTGATRIEGAPSRASRLSRDTVLGRRRRSFAQAGAIRGEPGAAEDTYGTPQRRKVRGDEVVSGLYQVRRSLQGMWRVVPAGVAVGVIKDNVLEWDSFTYDGESMQPVKIMIIGYWVSIELAQKVHFGRVELKPSPVIRWNDGEVWYKEMRPPGDCQCCTMEKIPPQVVTQLRQEPKSTQSRKKAK